jgi:sugar phosphate isomerase/epimerase
VAPKPHEAVETAKRAGFNNIEIPVTTWEINPETISNSDIKNIESICTSVEVKASSLGMIWPRKYSLITSSRSQWSRNLNYANKLFDLSSALEIEVMNLGGPEVRSVPADLPYYKGVMKLARFWRKACKHAEDVGVIVGIEHIGINNTNVANTTKQVLDLVEAVNSPSFQINAQIHEMVYADLDVSSAIKASEGLIKLVHIADVTGYNPIVDPVSFVTPGKGNLDFTSIFRALKDIGYDGEVCMEPNTNTLNEDYISELREGKELLMEKWKEA